MLAFERVLRRDRVGRDAEDIRAGTVERRFQPGKVDGLFGAAGCVGSRIEIEHELPPGEILERNRPAAIARQGERGGFAANLNGLLGAKLCGFGRFCRFTMGDAGNHVPSFRRFPRGIVRAQTTRASRGVDLSRAAILLAAVSL